MAHVNFDGLNLRITLDKPERRAVHIAEFVVPRANLAGVDHVPDVWEHVRHDIGVLGLGFPGICLWGTAYNRTGQDFCVLDRSRPGLIITLRNHTHQRVLLSLPPDLAWPLYARLREVVTEDATGPDEPAGG
jgi:hypothetical protein